MARTQDKGYLVDVGEATGADGTKVRLVASKPDSELTVILTGPCSWPPDREGGPPTGQLAPLAPPSAPKQAGDALGTSVCESPKLKVYNKSAPRYTGPGPHTITMISLLGANNRSASTPELPK